MKISLWSLPRTGSTYVYQSLNRFINPNLPSDPILNEYFNYENNSPNIDFFFNLLNQKEKWVVKSQITHDVPLIVYEYLNKNNDYSLLLLRKNWFDMIASSCLAELTSEWVNGLTSVYIGKKDTVSFEFFQQRFDYFWWKLVYNYKNIKLNKLIFYEDLSFWPRKDFFILGLINDINDCDPLKISVKKQKDKLETILNYKELYNWYENDFYLKNYENDYFYFDSNKNFCIKND